MAFFFQRRSDIQKPEGEIILLVKNPVLIGEHQVEIDQSHIGRLRGPGLKPAGE